MFATPAAISYSRLPNRPESIVVRVDTKYADFQLQRRGEKLVGELAISSCYSWRGTPIGLLVSQGVLLKSIQTEKTRAVLIIDESGARVEVLTPTQRNKLRVAAHSPTTTIFQSGPRLIAKGKLVTSKQMKLEGFRPGVYRTTRHSAIGITKEGKLILLYMSCKSLMEVGRTLLRLGAVDGISCDGGAQAYIHTPRVTRGNRSVVVFSVNSRKK